MKFYAEISNHDLYEYGCGCKYKIVPGKANLEFETQACDDGSLLIDDRILNFDCSGHSDRCSVDLTKLGLKITDKDYNKLTMDGIDELRRFIKNEGYEVSIDLELSNYYLDGYPAGVVTKTLYEGILPFEVKVYPWSDKELDNFSIILIEILSDGSKVYGLTYQGVVVGRYTCNNQQLPSKLYRYDIDGDICDAYLSFDPYEDCLIVRLKYKDETKLISGGYDW